MATWIYSEWPFIVCQGLWDSAKIADYGYSLELEQLVGHPEI